MANWFTDLVGYVNPFDNAPKGTGYVGNDYSRDASLNTSGFGDNYNGGVLSAPSTAPWNEKTGTTTTTTQAPTYDMAAYNQYMNEKGSILDSVNNRLNKESQGYGRGLEDYYIGAKSFQDSLNQKAAQNELARMQGRSDILGKVGRGITSAGVMLGQKNAGSSSAAGAIANAYGQIGNRDIQKVEQGYGVNQEGINLEQQNFNESNQIKTKRIEEDKSNIINDIAKEAETQLKALNAKVAGASLPNRIAIEQEKNRIISQATSKLSEYDRFLNQSRGLAGRDANANRAEAQRLQGIGVAAEQPFQFQQQDNMQQQMQGPAGGNLPLYTLPRKRLG